MRPLIVSEVQPSVVFLNAMAKREKRPQSGGKTEAVSSSDAWVGRLGIRSYKAKHSHRYLFLAHGRPCLLQNDIIEVLSRDRRFCPEPNR